MGNYFVPALLCFIMLFAPFLFAEVKVTYPVKATVGLGSAVEIGSVSRGETFDLAFASSSGGSDWDSLRIDSASLPSGWSVVSISSNDASHVAKISVPQSAKQGNYVISATLVGKQGSENAGIAVSVKESLLDVSFARSTSSTSVVGGKVVYKAIITNASIAPETVAISSNLPSNWFAAKTVEAKPASSVETELVVYPLVSGSTNFSFAAASQQKGIVVKSFSSELHVKPTIKGTLGSMFSGFPFFTFTLLPFQLLDAYISMLFY